MTTEGQHLSTHELPMVERSAEKLHIWLNEVGEEMGEDDRQVAYRLLRAYLHTLRDYLPVNEVAQLGAQLPILIRGVYYENWKPGSEARPERTIDGFLERVAKEGMLHGETEASYAVAAAGRVLARHVSAGEMDDVRAVLPAALRDVVGG